METEKRKSYCTDRRSDEYLEINSCGIEHIYKLDRGSDRPYGRSDYHLIYVEKGVCNLFIDGEYKRLPAGSVILFRPNEPQKYYYLKDENSVSHYVHFTGVGCEALLKRLGIYEVRVFAMGQSATYREVSEKMACEFAMRKPMYMDWCTAYLHQLLNVVARKYALLQNNINPKSEGRINSACMRIYENIKEPPSTEELAAEHCLSVSRFIHLFKEITGKSVTDFVTALRVERAKEMLFSTDMTIGEISEAVGFEDQNYFSRRFRKIEGVSPAEYRKNVVETDKGEESRLS